MDSKRDDSIYNGIPDEELIERLRGGDDRIMDYICEKYKNLVLSKARFLHILGGDSEDLIQEGMIGLFKAVRDYDANRGAGFSTFAQMCINRQIYTAVQASQRKKHFPLNNYVSLYEAGDREQEKDVGLVETLSAQDGLDPEKMVLDRERVEYLKTSIDSRLSPLEKQVLDLYMTGMSYTEIAKRLKRDEKSTDNALRRLKSKIRELL